MTGAGDSLGQATELALAWAPQAGVQAYRALFGLDARLASLVRQSREPMLAQIRFAWWRDTLLGPTGGWPRGDAVLDALARLQPGTGLTAALTCVVDGWERLVGEADDWHAHAAERGALFRACALATGSRADLAGLDRAGARWALWDTGRHLSAESDRRAAAAAAIALPAGRVTTARALRPLAVLHALADADIAGGEDRLVRAAAPSGMRSMLRLLRAGWLGR